MQDLDFRTLRLVLGSPSGTNAELTADGDGALLSWPCGCNAIQRRLHRNFEVDWCAFHHQTFMSPAIPFVLE